MKLIADEDMDDTYSDGSWSTDSDSQVTTYSYGDSVDASRVTEVEYPDSSGSSDVVSKTYNRDGTLASRTDQRGTKLEFSYNSRRQQTLQKASTLGGNTDGAIRAIGRSYDSLGRLTKVTSYSDTSASTVVNEVEQTYTDAGKLDEQYQAHDGSVSTLPTPSVGSSYETADRDNVGNGIFNHGGRRG